MFSGLDTLRPWGLEPGKGPQAHSSSVKLKVTSHGGVAEGWPDVSDPGSLRSAGAGEGGRLRRCPVWCVDGTAVTLDKPERSESPVGSLAGSSLRENRQAGRPGTWEECGRERPPGFPPGPDCLCSGSSAALSLRVPRVKSAPPHPPSGTVIRCRGVCVCVWPGYLPCLNV